MAVLPQFGPIFAGEISFSDAIQPLNHENLREFTDQIYDIYDAALADAADSEVVLVPNDPAADPGTPGWTVGHLIAHLTAGLEENAAQASSLARGVNTEGRSRNEAPWETITAADQVRHRLRESRKMVRGLWQAWPDQPDLNNTMLFIERIGHINAVGRYAVGLMHAMSHVEQVREALRQARA
ncbi:MAG TPA: DinB family protein [Chloroflexota bacterium]|nr:DinB family protein [Chloroflexota bacterium]